MKYLKKILTICLLIIFKFSFSQEIEIPFDTIISGYDSITSIVVIDPIFTQCYELERDEKIPVFIDNSNYTGKSLFSATYDTIELKLSNYQLLFAKLNSKINDSDTIEIRLDYKFGNYRYLDSITPQIIKHIGELKIRKTNFKNCQNVIFNIPIRINNQ